MGLRVFGPKAFEGGDVLLRLDGRSVGEPDARRGSSSNFSGRGFLDPVNPRPEGEAVAGPRFLLSAGLSCEGVLLPTAGRKVSFSDLSGRGFLAVVTLRPKGADGETEAGLRVFLPEGFSGEDLLLPGEGRPVFAAGLGPPCGARTDFRSGFLLFTDKGSPRVKKGKKRCGAPGEIVFARHLRARVRAPETKAQTHLTPSHKMVRMSMVPPQTRMP
jgi:hypothetical protein